MALGKNLTKPDKKEQHAAVSTKEAPASEPSPLPAKPTSGGAKPQEPEEEQELVNYEQFCVFDAGGEEYAISIHLVKEVVLYPDVAPIPQMPDYVLGMSNVRGNIYGVLDLVRYFEMDLDEEAEASKYLLVIDHEEYKMGIAIPEVPDTIMVSDNMIEKLSASRRKSVRGQKYLKGIIKKDRRMIILFDILDMISSDKFTETS